MGSRLRVDPGTGLGRVGHAENHVHETIHRSMNLDGRALQTCCVCAFQLPHTFLQFDAPTHKGILAFHIRMHAASNRSFSDTNLLMAAVTSGRAFFGGA